MILFVSTIAAVLMALGVFAIRMKASKKPATVKKIILPPFFMSTGALMYVFEPFRLSGTEIIEAILLGMFFSIFLIMTSRFEIKDEQIYIKRSKAFVFVLLGLIVVRTLLKFILSSSIDVGEIGGMFFLIAFSMIVPWRVAMYYQYKKLERNLNKPHEPIAL
ncbi:CcdC family protein [Pradoshia eiseniae]